MNRRMFLGVGAAGMLGADVLPNSRVALGVIGVGWMGLATMKIFMGDPRVQIADQAFQFQEPVLRDHLRVLLRIDAGKTGLAPNRRILPARQQDLDFPMSWIRRYEKGRVFYLGLGHGAPVYAHAGLMAHLLAGIQYALGDLPADDRPDKPEKP